MMNAARLREQLKELVESTESPIYTLCDEIVDYLTHNPTQQDLTVGGLRAALNKKPEIDNILIQAAFALTAHPLSALEVRYRLYDILIEDVLEELTHTQYLTAISEGSFIDDDGNDIPLRELNERIYPYFINKLTSTMEATK
ncbi:MULTISPECIES: hypothetical protein [Vibrio]|uniref:hypothetical protein n=1 Tax=Vibrio TaxID=662 RepID=UPI00076A8F70|nr:MULTISPECIES: hypothetical protein [Vibrio]PHX05044.1 hypothetical protein VSPL_33740 [Vibrio splendidus]PMJ05490.1 hypothetical protein BCU31_07935 [Vibrio lentus]